MAPFQSNDGFEDYLASECDSPELRAEEVRERDEHLARFPHTVMLKISFPELDFANRWCWQNLGPCDGGCSQNQSEYPVCDLTGPHSHSGKWMSHWLAKTDYNFGFNEWCFAEQGDQECFLAYLPKIHWGENYSQ